MSRRTPHAPANPPAGAYSTSDPDDLHRRALAIRAARTGRAAQSGPTVDVAGPASVARTVPDAATEIETGPDAGRVIVALPVRGMTCRSCELRIAKHVGRVAGVEKVTASSVHGRVVVETSAPVARASIEQAINKAGYEVGGTPWVTRDSRVWLTAGAGLLLAIGIAVVAQATGIADIASSAGDLGSGGIVVALLLGLAAGVSTCMALVGGLVLALSASFQARRTALGLPDASVAGAMRPAAVFVAGRVAGYAALGAVLGAIGAGLTMPPQLTAALMIGVALVMTLLGTRLTELSPRLAGWSPTLPMGLGTRLGLTGGEVGAYSDRRAAVLGAATFFLPCGFTQAVQIFALSTGNAVYAGALMAVFAIGTAPGLLALAGLPVVVPGRARPTMLRLVGVVVIGFALVNVTSGLRLAGVALPSLGAQPAVAAVPTGTAGSVPSGTEPGTQPAAAEPGADRQALTTFQHATGYEPANATIYAGMPTTWTIESSTVRTCAAFFVVPDLGIQMIFEEGPNTIELPAMPAGTLAYSCSMGMYGGQITIVDRPTGLITTGG